MLTHFCSRDRVKGNLCGCVKMDESESLLLTLPEELLEHIISRNTHDGISQCRMVSIIVLCRNASVVISNRSTS